jgi:hypothetical protein
MGIGIGIDVCAYSQEQVDTQAPRERKSSHTGKKKKTERKSSHTGSHTGAARKKKGKNKNGQEKTEKKKTDVPSRRFCCYPF